MDVKMYAQLDADNICTCVSTYKTDIEATYENFGQRYVDGSWENVEPEKPIIQPYQPSNAEVAQMISDLQADLIIAGVI